MQSNEQHIPDQTRSLNTMVHQQIGLDSSTLECSGCFNLINERYYLSVNDRVWHLNCLRCTDCKLCLDTQQSCFAKDGFIYCKEDYFKRFPRKCHGCCQQLSSSELIMKAKHLLFHIQCFKCLLCDKQLNPGDEFGIDRDGFTVLCRLHYYNNLQQHQSEFENNLTPYNNNINSNVKTEPTFYNNPNNDESHQTLIPSIYNQQQQQQQIMNNYDSSSYLLHHPATNMFNQNLINPKHQIASSPINQNNSKGRPKKRKTTNSGDNQPVAKKQTKSKQNTENNKNNINNNKLHSATPSLMNNNNNKQEASLNSEALSNNNLLVNQQHQSVNLNNPLILGSSVESPDDYTKHFDSNLDYYTEDDENNHNNTTNNEDDDDDEDGEDDEDLLLDTSSNGQANNNNDISLLSSQHNNSNGYYDSVAAVAAAAAAAQRQKRMRTSFKHHQLRVMKSYFELNHNPDAKDLKQLSQKTGLSKRVLQVWFQNARAKFRRGQGGPCDQMTASNSSSQQLSPNSSLIINNNNNNSKDLSTDLAGHGSLLSHHNDLLDENSSQSLSDKKTSSASSFSSSSSSNNIKSETSYSILTNSNSANNNLFHHQHPHHHLHLQQQHQQQHHLIQQQLQINSNRNDFTSSNLIVDNLVIN